MKTEKPETITVFGAGVEAVNGEYSYAGKGKFLPPIYSMKRRVDGKDVTSSIYFSTVDARWCIGNAENGTHEYKSIRGVPRFPPCRGWWSNPISCPPILFCHGENCLDWRKDATESLADYPIEIVHENDDCGGVGTSSATTYYCHKVILASTSEYFARLLLAKGCKDGLVYAEVGDNMSRIVLAPLAAAMFPHFLDYCYCHFGRDKSQLEGEFLSEYNADDVVFYWLADYFEVTQLRRQIERSLKAYMAVTTCWEYLRPALELGVPRILDDAIECGATHITQFDDIHLGYFAEELDVPSLLVFLQKKGTTEVCSRKASEIVSAFLSYHEIDGEIFKKLTDASLLPHIDPSAAWELLEWEMELLDVHSAVVSDLQERCISGLATKFTNIDSSDNGPLSLQSPAFVLALFRKCQQVAQAAAEADAQEAAVEGDAGAGAVDEEGVERNVRQRID